MLRVLAITLNGLLLIFVGYLLFENGPPNNNETWLVLLMIVTPVISTIALFRRVSADGDGFFSLFLKRMKLEQELKIKELKKQLR